MDIIKSTLYIKHTSPVGEQRLIQLKQVLLVLACNINTTFERTQLTDVYENISLNRSTLCCAF